MTTFRLVLPTFPFSSCLAELRACYSDALRRAGYAVTLSDRYLQPGEAGEDYQLAFGAHAVAPPRDHDRMVVMNSEHHEPWFTPEYRRTLSHALLIVNMGPFSEAAGLGPPLVEIQPGIMSVDAVDDYSPLGPGFDEDRDLDVVWYGSVTPRRAAILESLTAAGVHVTALYGVLGAERDRYIDRAKVVLDLKQVGTEPDDQTRVFWSLSRGACTLSENAARGLLANITPESAVSAVQICLGHDGETWRRRCRDQYAAALGPCDVSPLLAALGLGGDA